MGILNGAVGEAAIADPLAEWFCPHPAARALRPGHRADDHGGPHPFSVVVGELLPKRLAAGAGGHRWRWMARPMMILARVTHPLVVILSGLCSAHAAPVGARRRKSRR